MNIQAKSTAATVRKEGMRIAGKRVDLDEQIEVRNPYNGVVVGTVDRAGLGAAQTPQGVRLGLLREAYGLPDEL